MKNLTIPLLSDHPFTQESAAVFINTLAHYDASVMICDGNRTINAKSLLGVLSLGRLAAPVLHFTIDGIDESAVEEMLIHYFR